MPPELHKLLNNLAWKTTMQLFYLQSKRIKTLIGQKLCEHTDLFEYTNRLPDSCLWLLVVVHVIWPVLCHEICTICLCCSFTDLAMLVSLLNLSFMSRPPLIQSFPNHFSPPTNHSLTLCPDTLPLTEPQMQWYNSSERLRFAWVGLLALREAW